MEPIIARGVMILCPAKKIWDTLRLTYGYKKNILRVFEVYKQLFTLHQGDRSVQEHFTVLRALLDELDVYQPLTIDISRMRQYRDELAEPAVAVYLSGLNLDLCS